MKKVLITLAGIVTGVVLLVVGCTALVGGTVHGVDQQIQQQEADLQADVKFSSCKVDSVQFVTVSYTITNHSSANRDYLIEVDVMRGDVRVGTANGFESGVPPQGKVKGSATGTLDTEGKGKITCVLRSA